MISTHLIITQNIHGSAHTPRHTGIDTQQQDQTQQECDGYSNRMAGQCNAE